MLRLFFNIKRLDIDVCDILLLFNRQYTRKYDAHYRLVSKVRLFLPSTM